MRRLLAALAFSVSFAAGAAEPYEAFFDAFLGDLKSELADARASGRKGVMVMYHFDECPYCQRMKKDVLSRRDVQQALRKDFVVLAIDTRGAQPITGLDGRTLPENEYARSVGIRATPTFDFYAPGGERLYRHVGGIADPQQFIALGRYVASGAHRSQTFSEFRQTAK
jgi:thioredoxin-related protein